MIEQENKTKKITDSYKTFGPYLGLGTQLAATIILMFFLGRWLDQKLNTFPFLLIIFSIIGGFAGIYNFIKTVLRLNDKKQLNKKP